MKVRTVILFCVLFIVPGCARLTTGERLSVEQLCTEYPGRVSSLFENLNLERKGMEPVKAAVAKRDWPEACTALLKYYQEGTSGSWLRREAVKKGTGSTVRSEKYLQDVFTFQSVEGKLDRTEDGNINWIGFGPRNNAQWAAIINRHLYMLELMDDYAQTGNSDYVRLIETHLQDWILSRPNAGKEVVEKGSDGQLIADAWPWYPLNAGIRVVKWVHVFYGLQKEEVFSPASRILVLSSLAQHGHYLRRFHRKDGNQCITTMLGLASIAVAFPEFKDSSEWLEYSTDMIVQQGAAQVYPDGAQKELTGHYHRIVLNKFEGFNQMVRNGGGKPDKSLVALSEKMNNYMAYAMRPDGYGLLNNDSDLDYWRDILLKAAGTYNQSDWTYIASNGTEGKVPSIASTIFPWAGHFIMRNGWDSDAHWAFFDIGPFGQAHVHSDKLHLSVSAYGRDILVDSGRYTYTNYHSPTKGTWRRYFIGAEGHNTIMIDGQGQRLNRRENTETPINKEFYAIEPAFDYARGSTTTKDYIDKKWGITTEGNVEHTRAVMYVRDKYWVVVDHIETDRPRIIQALWHYHPDCTVEIAGDEVTSVDEGKGNLRIVPVSSLKWKLDIVKGQKKPHIQGWYSKEANDKQANSAAIYSTKIDKSATFAWVLVPARGLVPHVKAQILQLNKNEIHLRLTPIGERPIEVTVPIRTGMPKIELSD